MLEPSFWTIYHFWLSDAAWIKAALSPPYRPFPRQFHSKLRVTSCWSKKKNSPWESIQWKSVGLQLKKKKMSVMSKDAFPKIRLCTVVEIQSGIAPRLCTSWRTHRTVGCQKGLPGSCRERTGAISNPEASSGFQMLPLPGLHVSYQGHSFVFGKRSRFQRCWSTRAPLPFPIWVGTSDPRAGTQVSSQLCHGQGFLILAPGAPQRFFRAFTICDAFYA